MTDRETAPSGGEGERSAFAPTHRRLSDGALFRAELGARTVTLRTRDGSSYSVHADDLQRFFESIEVDLRPHAEAAEDAISEAEDALPEGWRTDAEHDLTDRVRALALDSSQMKSRLQAAEARVAEAEAALPLGYRVRDGRDLAACIRDLAKDLKETEEDCVA